MRIARFIALLCSIFMCLNLSAQLSGIINAYTPVTALQCNTVEVANPLLFSAGDRVLIIQMKGAEINTTNTNAFGTVVNYNNCGNYEFATIAAISGNTIIFQYQLLHAYDVTGFVQLISVPQYTDITVSGPLTAMEWNGNTGGVLVMEVSGTLTMDAPISLTAAGFRGAFGCNNPDGGCGYFPDYYYPVSSGHGAEKGEGIASSAPGMDGGRGALANGGGGGNKHNSGGGGGSNGSMGGHGGDQANFCGPQPIGGDGGKALDYSTGKIFLGGGGGSSDHNNNVGSSGSDGGGIVIIRATNLVSNSTFIASNGADVGVVPNNIGDGAGGGGAGGTIVLDVQNFIGNLELRVNGGNGGNQQTTYPACFGPGGGGGTGAILTSGNLLPPNVTTQFTPGNAGTDLTPSSTCYLQSYGATPGQAGSLIRYNNVLPESTILAETIDLGPDIVTCDPTALISPGIAAASYQWSTGETTPAITVSASGEYWLTVTSPGSGCTASDTIQVDLGDLTVDAGIDQSICLGQTVTLQATSSEPAVITWNNGIIDILPFSPETTAIYTVTATNTDGCIATDEVMVTVIPLPDVSLSVSDTQGCAPLTVTFENTTPGCQDCSWLFSDGTVLEGCGSQSHTFALPGCYDVSLTVTSNSGCTGTADFLSIVCVSPKPVASFDLSPNILYSGNTTTTMVNTSTGAISYEWSFGDGSQNTTLFSPVHSYSVDNPGSFLITLAAVAENGCTDTAYRMIYVEDNLIYYVPNAFTPDGDEFNQVFLPVFTSGFDPYDFNMKIYDRWGETVFESNNHEIGWDGTYHGRLVQDGVFTWLIEFKVSKNDERKTIQGHLNVLK